ncbi:MAG: hypothetical protein VKI81_09860 [Synechococcaceae cyanobacterium]|nr:hypothetical protein [Synechococcaceae cyanobacterium]
MLALPILLAATGVRAQGADVIRPDAQGDFPSVDIPGGRGTYRQRFWLVVDRDPRGLWCRDATGRPSIALRYGAVIEIDPAAGPPSPVVTRQGKPHLRVRVKPVDILHDARLRGRGTPAACVVRANSSFLAPIHPESMAAASRRAGLP